ncbi:unnamed protein product [Caenorhabditis auriculariae]|uniref:Uncharacterized protein n=1 Tax=Caenorhabditis auriculariae TaxID=2777116 RepID=A0A8S1GUK8_9PELO|nr:unnamed protein product [Caenorhabditis auriculariae]
MLLGRTPQKRDDKLAELRDAAEEVHSPPPPPQNAALARVKPPEPTASLVKSWMRGTFKVWSDRDPAYQKIALVATTVATAPKLDHVLTGQVDQTLRATLSEPNLIQIHEGLLNALNGPGQRVFGPQRRQRHTRWFRVAPTNHGA